MEFPVTADQVRQTVIDYGITHLPHHDCGGCGKWVKYVFTPNTSGMMAPFFDSNCGCTDRWTPCSARNWEEVAKFINQRDPVVAQELWDRLMAQATKQPAAKPVPEHISDERLAEIIKGCEGVTPGPWKIYDGCSWRRIGTLPSRDHYDGAVLAPCVASDGHPDLTSYAGDREANLAHIARLDPQTVLSLLTELQHRRAAEADHVADAGKKVAADGWVLVPRELTLEMEQAHYDAHAKAETVFASAPEVWSAILASAPKPNHLGGRLICEALGFDPTNHHNADKCPYCSPAASPSSPVSGVRVKATHRHVKRGSEYVLIGIGKMQAEDWREHHHNVGYTSVDMEPVAIYRATEDGSLWARPQKEFEDGRFEALSALGEHP